MIEELVEKINKNLELDDSDLNKLNVLKCFNLIKSYNLDLDSEKEYFNSLITKNPNYYKKILFRNSLFELILIRWDKGFESILHKHPKNGCVLKVIKGKIIEHKFFNNELYESKTLSKNDMGYMHDILGSHKIKAIETSFTLHLYSPPNYYN